MARKTIRFNKSGLDTLPENKPVVYKIITKSGTNNYTGIAKRGRVQEKLSEHLPGGPDAIPGAKVIIEQVDNLPTAKKKEANTIKRTQPKYNKQGKQSLQAGFRLCTFDTGFVNPEHFEPLPGVGPPGWSFSGVVAHGGLMSVLGQQQPKTR